MRKQVPGFLPLQRMSPSALSAEIKRRVEQATSSAVPLSQRVMFTHPDGRTADGFAVPRTRGSALKTQRQRTQEAATTACELGLERRLLQWPMWQPRVSFVSFFHLLRWKTAA